MGDAPKKPATIRMHIRWLEQAARDDSGTFTDEQKRDAYTMACALRWVLQRDFLNPTRFILLDSENADV